jgi:hypothetical protein
MRGVYLVRILPLVLIVTAIFLDAATSQWCFSFTPGCVEGNAAALKMFDVLHGMWPTALVQAGIITLCALPLWWRRVWIGGPIGWLLWGAVLLLALHRFTVVLHNLGNILSN